ncbi:hypothetical protein EIP91_006914 [Steccherinum ochraceum]|uniref:Uncharacterized protein n=1 Tax=Steccherinum ochraceum TaxID=92696 RepID=A0A4R0R7M2_9APHY|nr:hypothetical protein EIP91_006914 [Steccherinum ochraceum]
MEFVLDLGTGDVKPNKPRAKSMNQKRDLTTMAPKEREAAEKQREYTRLAKRRERQRKKAASTQSLQEHAPLASVDRGQGGFDSAFTPQPDDRMSVDFLSEVPSVYREQFGSQEVSGSRWNRGHEEDEVHSSAVERKPGSPTPSPSPRQARNVSPKFAGSSSQVPVASTPAPSDSGSGLRENHRSIASHRSCSDLVAAAEDRAEMGSGSSGRSSVSVLGEPTTSAENRAVAMQRVGASSSNKRKDSSHEHNPPARRPRLTPSLPTYSRSPASPLTAHAGPFQSTLAGETPPRAMFPRVVVTPEAQTPFHDISDVSTQMIPIQTRRPHPVISTASQTALYSTRDVVMQTDTALRSVRDVAVQTEALPPSTSPSVVHASTFRLRPASWSADDSLTSSDFMTCGKEYQKGAPVVVGPSGVRAGGSLDRAYTKEDLSSVRLKTHARQDLGRLDDLLLLADSVSAQFSGENVDDVREGMESGMSVEEIEAVVTSNGVDGCLSGLVASGIANFSFNI